MIRNHVLLRAKQLLLAWTNLNVKRRHISHLALEDSFLLGLLSIVFYVRFIRRQPTFSVFMTCDNANRIQTRAGTVRVTDKSFSKQFINL